MTKQITAEEFDRKFDAGEDISEYVDWSSARRPNLEKAGRVNVDFPAWVVAALDAQAARLGITRQAVIKVWIAERLDAEADARARRAAPLPARAEAAPASPDPEAMDPAA